MVLYYVKKLDWLLCGLVGLLVVISLISLWSLSLRSESLFYKQIIWIATGFIVCFAASTFDYRVFKDHGGVILLLYAILVLSLIVLFMLGVETRGVVSWFHVKGITLQPVEPVKLILVILLAKYFSKRHIEIQQMRHLFISGFYAFVPFGLVMMQPDLGSAAILMMIWISSTLFSGIKFSHFASLILIFALLAGVGWTTVLKPYQKERIISFLNPYADPRGAGYNTIQSLIAVGSGGVWGKGIGQGSQSHLLFLPEAETDFIFAAFAEEWGLVGNTFLLLIYACLMFRMLKIGRESENNFAKLFVLGFVTLIFAQIVIHIGMNTALFPITGITLPFVSYGGSSFVTLMAGLGIIQSIHIYSRKEVSQKGSASAIS
ncbi:MAG: rod shape-determining protein RodA [Candidatus Sungbacteria bacterium RIFCSPLOWO2_02_FULL_47_9]|uniref:Rod shape-determining protein RodA n=1 Tax=Candidatus Sungbacteria bacterium RIFCSPHIGHO2_01_FULL_47_32 TaxID=1802264 RepID=A0A1G2K827_9BACT|nr:MAG: rod shape-determining protein RodA [Candidatus Sungbacteria bacterium RIFCSPHIGHO2_01_FULL_47_32]OHA10325.1 MAG: rod shape-determining protein RodA [Candidatus Sungbacteria bacterium RIFCSPLOWO2_02_FULL_47_9]